MILRSAFDHVIKSYLSMRHRRLSQLIKNAPENQEDLRKSLVTKAKNTEYGKKYNFENLKTFSNFQRDVPIVGYEELFPFIDRVMMGQRDVLWPGLTEWFAKSSGTTDRSKYIPVTKDFLRGNLVKSSWDSVGFIYNKRKDAKLFSEKSMLMGGALSSFDKNANAKIGDISAIMLSTMPSVGRPFYTPDFDTALMSDWEQKIEIMAQKCMKENVMMFGGVPTWLVVFFDRMLEITGKKNMTEIWPSAHSYMHGGVGFGPYVEKFKTYFPKEDFDYWEVYNASEGYFSITNDVDADGMLLLIDNDIFFEFIPIDRYHSGDLHSLLLSEVEMDRDYVMVISTSAGLWRYIPGDTVRFTSLTPHRIKVTGRTKQFLNIFGEELMVHNTDEALRICNEKHGCRVTDYMVGPVFMDDSNKGGHEWLVEFEQEPNDIVSYENDLDIILRQLNSDYDAKRSKDLALTGLKLNKVPNGVFYSWLGGQGKLGGQNKIPRLTNTRKIMEEIKAMI